jgi:glycosyltransferase involved in cell wall biosynthesis
MPHDGSGARGKLLKLTGLSPPAYLVGLVGRTCFNHKGHDVFVRAARMIAETMPRARFVVIGDGPDQQELRALVRNLGLADRFSLLGWQPDAAYLIRGLDLLVSSSRMEGFPLVLIEAMQSGVPVVGTRVGGNADYLRGENLVPPEAPEQLARKAIWIASMPAAERRRMTGGYRAMVTKELSPAACYRRFRRAVKALTMRRRNLRAEAER